MTKLTPVIGMEVHVELTTKSKMFCGCSAKHFQVKPNTHTCPVCLGLPGALPVPNKKAIDYTAMIGLALNCQINKVSKFDRKHYFYPDLPKGYQISQYDQPLCVKGQLKLDSGKTIRITRVHIEEDTGKLVHKTLDGKKVSLVDFNRSGVPLVEIVTEPDITSGAEAKEYLKKLHQLVKALKVSDCDMEKGSMRLEANISLKPCPKPYKIEVKNLNSFRFVEKAINYELKRQASLLKKGTVPIQETRGFNSKSKTTFFQRTKEEAQDYRYFPEPDIPPMVFTDKDIKTWKSFLPKLPEQTVNQLITNYQLPQTTAKLLTKSKTALKIFKNHLSQAKKSGLSEKQLADILINKKATDKNIKSVIQSLTTKKTVDETIISKILKENPDVVKKYKSGKTQVIGFLVGQVMKQTKGQADPNQTKDSLLKLLK